MKTLQVHSLSLKDVIKDLASLMQVKYQRNCGEYSFNIPLSWGSGKIEGINFEGGLGLIIYNCTFNSDVEIIFSANEVHPLKFLYCVKGSLIHRFENTFLKHELKKYQNIIVANKDPDGHVLVFNKDEFTHVYSLEIDRKIFKLKMACEIGKAEPHLQDIFEDDTAKKDFYYKGHYSLGLGEIFDQMEAHHYNHFVGKIFTETQSYRMLTQQLIQFDDDSKMEIDQTILRKVEASAILEAIEIMKTELDMLGSIGSIALRVGLGDHKLQNGFKVLYGKTANEYVQYLKMNLAKDLLINTDDTIQEIKYKIGFNSHSYFSELFKKINHCSPSEYRKNHRSSRKQY